MLYLRDDQGLILCNQDDTLPFVLSSLCVQYRVSSVLQALRDVLLVFDFPSSNPLWHSLVEFIIVLVV